MISLCCSSSLLSPLFFSFWLCFLFPEDYTLFTSSQTRPSFTCVPKPSTCCQTKRFSSSTTAWHVTISLPDTPEGFGSPLQHIPFPFADRLRMRHLFLGLCHRPQQKQASQTISVLKTAMTAIHKLPISRES